jgi:hypothetical protein
VSKRLGSTYRSSRSKHWIKGQAGGAGSAARGGRRLALR